MCVAAGTATFPEDRLYDVLVCFVNSPFSFYVQIRDDEQVSHSTQSAELPLYLSWLTRVCGKFIYRLSN